MAKRPKRPRDPNQLGKLIVDLATGNAEPEVDLESKFAVQGRKGGQKGGKARAASLDASTRKKIAQQAAKARWAKKHKGKN